MQSLYNFQEFDRCKDKKVNRQYIATPCKRYFLADILYEREDIHAIIYKEKARH